MRPIYYRGASVDVAVETGVWTPPSSGASGGCVDYPDVAAAVAQAVSRGQVERGILICGTGVGMCIAANKFPGVRAALCCNEIAAEMSRRHNNANVICLSGEFLSPAVAERIVRIWLETGYEEGRHARRVGKISEIERETGL
ncbi:MAG: ribose 5-phosphate isomerase B [Thermoguttaceae bacterium]|nr:ribose 5-phosphate isomerase B [Thermoguttaceae bacterium]